MDLKGFTDAQRGYIEVASRLTAAERKKRMAVTDEAITKGAVTGPDSVWPDPKVKLSAPQTKEEEHWTRHALRLSAAERKWLRGALADLPDAANPEPMPKPAVQTWPGQGQGGRGASV